jgi:hypothetical protein
MTFANKEIDVARRERNQPRDFVATRALRRAVELVASLFARRKMKRFVGRLSSGVQDSVGAPHNSDRAPALVRVRASAAAMRKPAALRRDPFGR